MPHRSAELPTRLSSGGWSWKPLRISMRVWVTLFMTVPSGHVLAQPAAAPKYSTWSRIETAVETDEYKDRLKEASSLDQVSRAFLVEQALPQLAREENRSSIERVRRRIRERLLTEIGNNQVLAAANGVVASFMESVARDGAADPVVRVNATILIGELRGADGRSWPDSATRLAALARDPQMAPGVRVAAVAGLSRFGESLSEAPQLATAVGSAVMAILEEPIDRVAGVPRPEREWLAGRAAGLLPLIAAEYPKGVAESLARIVADDTRAIDARVRAAAVLGAGVGPKAGVDPAELVAAIEGMVVRMLGDESAAVEKRRFEQEYRAKVADGGGKAASEKLEEPVQSIPEHLLRRHAWRLVTLAGALDGGDGAVRSGKGIAGVAQGPSAEKAKGIAAKLREGGLALDADPTEATLVATLDSLQTAAQPQGGSAPPAADGTSEADDRQRPARPESSPEPSPFDTSPFN